MNNYTVSLIANLPFDFNTKSEKAKRASTLLLYYHCRGERFIRDSGLHYFYPLRYSNTIYVTVYEVQSAAVAIVTFVAST